MLFRWRGELIVDIKAWARERQEPMVVVEETRTELNPWGGPDIVTVEQMRMPRCFAEGLCVSQPNVRRRIL